jgi:hypothetical protein
VLEGEIDEAAQTAKLHHLAFGRGEIRLEGVRDEDQLPGGRGLEDVRMVGERRPSEGIRRLRVQRGQGGTEIEPVVRLQKIDGGTLHAEELGRPVGDGLEHGIQVQGGGKDSTDTQQQLLLPGRPEDRTGFRALLRWRLSFRHL